MESDEFLVDSFIDEFPMDVSSDVLPGDYSEVLDSVQDSSNVHYLIQMPVGNNIMSGMYTAEYKFSLWAALPW